MGSNTRLKRETVAFLCSQSGKGIDGRLIPTVSIVAVFQFLSYGVITYSRDPVTETGRTKNEARI